MTTAAIVLAGGAGTRMRAEDPKAYVPIGARPLLAWSLDVFEHIAEIDEIVLVVRAADTDRARALARDERLSKVRAIVPGGDTRHASERAGLDALAAAIDAREVDLVCIHDAARPFITRELVARVVAAARARGGAVPCLAFSEPVLLRRVRGSSVPEPVRTADLRRAQTPQAFGAAELLRAHRAAGEAGAAGVDTAEIVQRFGRLSVQAVPGDAGNIKVTYPDDLSAAEAVAARRAGRS